MENIGERVKYLRKKILDMTQEQFGAKINLKSNSVSSMETGVNIVTEDNIKKICDAYDVNEEWLRYGIEPIKQKRTKNQEIANFLVQTTKMDDNSFKKRFIEALSKLDADDWERLEEIVKEITKEGN